MHKLKSLLIIIAYFFSCLQNKIVFSDRNERQLSNDTSFQTDEQGTIKEPNKTFYVIRGSKAKLGQFPYVVSLQYSYERNTHFCGGTIITKEFVLSAAHCFCRAIPTKAQDVLIIAGHVDFNSKFRKEYTVERVTCHPQYSPRTFYHDLALIRIKKQFKFSPTLQAIPLAESPVPSGLTVTLAGWGETENYDSSDLRYLQTYTIPNTDCKQRMKEIEGVDIYVINSTICTLHPRGSQPCFGDSGSPLMYENKVIGVFSWIAGSYCKALQPDGYTSIAHHLSWIRYELMRSYN